MNSQDLIVAFSISQNQLEHFLKDITAEMAGQEVDGGGNPVNWILGHILTERVEAIEMTGVGDVCPIPDLSMYGTGTKPDPKNAVPYRKMRELINVTFDLLINALRSLDDQTLSEPRQETILGKPRDLGKHLFSYVLHEMYHIGQISIAKKQYPLS